MATKKKSKRKIKAKKSVLKKSASKVLTAEQRKRIQVALKGFEAKAMKNYQQVAKLSGKNWKTQSKVARKNILQAKKRIEVEVRKNPAGATMAAALIGAVAGALIYSQLKRR